MGAGATAKVGATTDVWATHGAVTVALSTICAGLFVSFDAGTNRAVGAENPEGIDAEITCPPLRAGEGELDAVAASLPRMAFDANDASLVADEAMAAATLAAAAGGMLEGAVAACAPRDSRPPVMLPVPGAPPTFIAPPTVGGPNCRSRARSIPPLVELWPSLGTFNTFIAASAPSLGVSRFKAAPPTMSEATCGIFETKSPRTVVAMTALIATKTKLIVVGLAIILLV